MFYAIIWCCNGFSEMLSFMGGYVCTIRDIAINITEFIINWGGEGVRSVIRSELSLLPQFESCYCC